ncbi:biotin transporter BioY [Schauerella aestuarii]|uniref:biotin transporter BioY n=1 Tax=Schauerella aestuarii TaxID=2511204 RepID=UPI00136D907E|nr:biotin transporter BioY [Achromobacter aestuarii]MYZ44311.1 biotin transporter BioY [Achromobacter aestuarii]
MHHSSLNIHANAGAPLYLHHRSLSVKAAAVIIGVLLLTLSSYLTIPMVPVPITLQTLVVTLIGALYGWRLGALTVVLWLAAGALGLPVLANGGSGLAKFTGPTAGYLFAFPLAAATLGWLAANGWGGARIARAFGAMLLGTALCLFVGGAWLAYTIGFEKAWLNGVMPFLVGGLIKSLVGALVLVALSATRSNKVAVA